jgi:hypothetical protein
MLTSQVRQNETTVGTALLRTGPDGRLTLTAYASSSPATSAPPWSHSPGLGARPPGTHRDHGHSV